MLARLTSLIALSLLLAALVAPSAALAQGSPFTPLPQPAPEPAPAPAPSNADEDDGLNDTQQLLIALAGIVLLAGIAWAIVRDARSNAPVDDPRRDPVLSGTAGEEDSRRAGSRTPKQQRVKTNRQKAKAARQARKRNARRR